MSFDVAIVGAGIVGACCALECARAGLRAVVIESRLVGGGATAAGMGHLVVMDDSEAQFALTRYSRELWAEMAGELPFEVEYDRCGTLWVAADEIELGEVERKRGFYEARGVRAETLDADSLAEAEPNLRAGLAGALLVPDDGVIYPPSAAQYLLDRAREKGAELKLGSAVTAITREGVRLGRDQLAAGIVVNATGAWAPELAPGIDVQKRKGHLVITGRHPGFVRRQLVELGYLRAAHAQTDDSVAFNVQPRRTGQVLVGSSRQYGASDPQVEPLMLARMVHRAIEFMPGLAELSAIRAWTGFRAATSDHLPLIGPSVSDDRCWLATGHEGLGITTAPGTARLLVDQLLGRRSAIEPSPYLPSRTWRGSAHA
jgi:glycine/D-amino acid oxidase-like deaminating enzyme